MKYFAVAAAAAAMVAAAGASASAQKARTLDEVVAHGAAAEKAMERSASLGSVAEEISHACEQFATQHNIGISIFIIDQYGQIVHEHRMDGQTANNVETALMKAKSALYEKSSTHLRMNGDIENPFREFRDVEMGLFPNKGGLPIIVDHQLLGAVGVGGSGMDEECANYALTQVLGPQPALAPNIPARPPMMGPAPQRGGGAAPAPAR
jgi:glc operon protein GlcG